MVMEFKSGTVLFASTKTSEKEIEKAKDYCKKNGLTPDTARIILTYEDSERKKPEMLLVIKK